MKIYKNKYRYHWISPYTICEKICFWREIDYNESWVERVNYYLTPACTLLMKFLDVVHPKIDYVKIDPWDIWNMDSTLSPIILPMLKQLKESKHGSPYVEDEDVPEELKSNPGEVYPVGEDPNFHLRWEWVLDEMIFAFEELCKEDWEDEFFPKSGDADHIAYEIHYKRIKNGLRLFGTYYMNLWD